MYLTTDNVNNIDFVKIHIPFVIVNSFKRVITAKVFVYSLTLKHIVAIPKKCVFVCNDSKSL